jgi:hypothetical protein
MKGKAYFAFSFLDQSIGCSSYDPPAPIILSLNILISIFAMSSLVIA